MLALSFNIFRHSKDPLYQRLGLALVLTIAANLILTFFGDRWTYLEINGLLWALLGAATRVYYLKEIEPSGDRASNRPRNHCESLPRHEVAFPIPHCAAFLAHFCAAGDAYRSMSKISLLNPNIASHCGDAKRERSREFCSSSTSFPKPGGGERIVLKLIRFFPVMATMS